MQIVIHDAERDAARILEKVENRLVMRCVRPSRASMGFYKKPVQPMDSAISL
jgi:hypothetical protein